MADTVRVVNGMDVAALRASAERARQDPASADRNPELVAEWVGVDHSRVRCRDKVLEVNTPGTLNPMQLLLASLAACDVDLVAARAAMLGVEIESLSVEASGHFNVRSYLGVEDAPGPGYDRISYTVRLHAPGATPEQVARLRRAVERSSPVGDSLGRGIPLTLRFEAET